MLSRSAGLIMANTVVGAAVGFAALKVFAVSTGPLADVLLGQLAFAMGIAGLFTMALDLGLGSAHIKRVSEGADLGAAIGSYAVAKVVLAAGFVAVVGALAFAGARLGVLQDTPASAVVVVGVYFALLGLRDVFTATFNGRGEFAKTQTVSLVENLTRAPLLMLFGLAFGAAVLQAGPLAPRLADGGEVLGLLGTHAATLLSGTYALAALASLLAAVLLFRRGYPLAPPRRGVLVDYWAFGRHVLLANTMALIFVSLDKVVVTAFWDPVNTGRYFGAQRFSDLIGTVPMAVYVVLFPAFASRYARGSRHEVRAAMEAAVRHVSLVVVPLAAFAIALAGPLLSLVLTGVFVEAVPTMRVLALFALVFALMHPYAALLQAQGRPEVPARAAIVATVLNLVLNLLLVPPPERAFGLPLPGLAELGAAIATLAAVLVQFLMLRRAVHRIDGPVPVGHVAKHLAAGAIMGLVLLALAPPPQDAPWWLMLALLALGGAVYLGVLALMREFTRHDLQLYLHLLDPAAMARHVAEEVQAHGPGGARRGWLRRPPSAP